MSIKAKIKRLLGGGNREQTLQERYPQYRIGRGNYGNPTILNWNEGASPSIGNFCSTADEIRSISAANTALTGLQPILSMCCGLPLLPYWGIPKQKAMLPSPLMYGLARRPPSRNVYSTWHGGTWSDESIEKHLPFHLSTDINQCLEQEEHLA